MDMEVKKVWLDVEFGVEVLCVTCKEKYGFCTECGGGKKLPFYSLTVKKVVNSELVNGDH